MLGAYKFVDTNELQDFLLSTHSKFGGFGKLPGDYPDVMHSYLGLSGLSISKEQTLKDLFVPIGISLDCYERAKVANPKLFQKYIQ
jgi:geranylgeranyl transferase type-1 subunit beta